MTASSLSVPLRAGACGLCTLEAAAAPIIAVGAWSDLQPSSKSLMPSTVAY